MNDRLDPWPEGCSLPALINDFCTTARLSCPSRDQLMEALYTESDGLKAMLGDEYWGRYYESVKRWKTTRSDLVVDIVPMYALQGRPPHEWFSQSVSSDSYVACGVDYAYLNGADGSVRHILRVQSMDAQTVVTLDPLTPRVPPETWGYRLFVDAARWSNGGFWVLSRA